MARALRLVTWNCRSGSVASRLDELRLLAPDIVFLQECDPARGGRVAGVVCSRAIKARKGIALCAADSCRCRHLTSGWQDLRSSRSRIARARCSCAPLEGAIEWNVSFPPVDRVFQGMLTRLY